MRYLGNKRVLLEEMDDFLHRHGVRGDVMLDVFSGTTTVARHFRSKGWTVHANDLMASSYVRQRAFLSLAKEPALPCWSLEKTVEELNNVAPRRGLFTRQFSSGGRTGRLYFTGENAQVLDGAWVQLLSWARDGEVDEDGFYLLLAIITEAADRVANIAGTYGAFLKKISKNAERPIEFKVPELDWHNPAGFAHREDGLVLADRLTRSEAIDLIYIDPPYNNRQYAKYYHLPELLAELHLAEDLAAYERGLYGKTGLRRFPDRDSKFCRSRDVLKAFQALIESCARAKNILLSYSEEGILSYDDIVQTMEKYGEVIFRRVKYKRFRSDSRKNRNVGEDYVYEWMFCCKVYSDEEREERSKRVPLPIELFL